MKIKCLGSGEPFSSINNSSFFFRDTAGHGILLDCGYSVFGELLKQNLARDVDTVLISHPHADHTGSLTTLAAYSRIVSKKRLIIGGWDVSDIFKAQGVLPDDFVKFNGGGIELIKTEHISAYGFNYAIYIENMGILYSGDTNQSLLDTEYAKRAKIIIHECTLNNSPVHTSFDRLKIAPESIRAKTYLTHIPENERNEIIKLAKEYGFAGVCENGQEIDF